MELDQTNPVASTADGMSEADLQALQTPLSAENTPRAPTADEIAAYIAAGGHSVNQPLGTVAPVIDVPFEPQAVEVVEVEAIVAANFAAGIVPATE